MRNDEHRALAAALLPVVLRAGAVEMEHFHNDVVVEKKRDDSPVTVADREAEEIITQALSELHPQIPVVGEEAVSAGILPETEGTFFLVDALDGTRDFVAGRTEFTVNVALIVEHAPLFGVVYQPVTGRLFMTLGHDHAIEADVAPNASSAITLDQLEMRRLATRQPDPGNLVVAVSRSHPSAELNAKLSELGIERLIKVGSSLKFCLVARGEADVYPRLISISEWDTAAGHAIVTAAGGVVVTLAGAPLSYGDRRPSCRIAPFVAWGRGELADRFSFS